jgi:hypothetical protein
MKKNETVAKYLEAVKTYVNSFIELLKGDLRKDKEKGYMITDDIKTFRTKYNSSFSRIS